MALRVARHEKALVRAEKLFQLSKFPFTLPQVVHVAAVRGTGHDLPEPSPSSFSSVIHSDLRTLDTSQMEEEQYGTQDDQFLLSLFRALSSHVLTTGSNLRAEPNLVYAPLSDPNLLALRKKWNLPNKAPTPVVLTRSARGIDFNGLFFKHEEQGACPILLVAEDAAADVERRLQAHPGGARADVVGCSKHVLESPSSVLEYLFTLPSFGACASYPVKPPDTGKHTNVG
jgi:hypothetical protein